MASPYAELTVYHPKPGLRTAAEIRRQKTRRQEGETSGAIFLLGGHRQSPRRRRGRRPRAHWARPLVCPDSGGGAQRLFPRHTVPGGCGAVPSGLCHTQLSYTRNPQVLPPPPHPPSVSLAATPRTGDPLLPGDASVSSQPR